VSSVERRGGERRGERKRFGGGRDVVGVIRRKW
jgi:hypothetical protein